MNSYIEPTYHPYYPPITGGTFLFNHDNLCPLLNESFRNLEKKADQANTPYAVALLLTMKGDYMLGVDLNAFYQKKKTNVIWINSDSQEPYTTVDVFIKSGIEPFKHYTRIQELTSEDPRVPPYSLANKQLHCAVMACTIPSQSNNAESIGTCTILTARIYMLYEAIKNKDILDTFRWATALRDFNLSIPETNFSAYVDGILNGMNHLNNPFEIEKFLFPFAPSFPEHRILGYIYGLCLSYQLAPERNECTDSFKNLCNQYSQDWIFLSTMAQLLSHTQNKLSLIYCYKQMLSIAPRPELVLSQLVDLYVELSRFEEATQCTRELLLKDPKNINFVFNLGRFLYLTEYQSEKNLRESLDCFQFIVNQIPEQEEAFVYLLAIHLLMHNVEQADLTAQKLWLINTQNPGCLVFQGLMCLYDDPHQSQTLFKQASELNPATTAFFHYANGKYLEYQKQFDLAYEQYRLACSLNTRIPEAWANAGILLYSTTLLNGQDWPSAKAYLKRAVYLRPHYSEAWFYLGLLAIDQIEFSPSASLEALDYLRKSVDANERQNLAWNLLAMLYAEDLPNKPRDLYKARQCINTSLKINSALTETQELEQKITLLETNAVIPSNQKE